MKWWKVWKGDKKVFVENDDRANAAKEGEKLLNIPSFSASIEELSDKEAIELKLRPYSYDQLEFDFGDAQQNNNLDSDFWGDI